MQARIQRFVEDRERLFASISHDLKTPITRLKLRTELLDDDALRADFHEDLDELDVMVKGALQSVKDSAVHENVADVRIDRLVERLTAPAIAAGARVTLDVPPLVVRGKPAGAQARAGQPGRQRPALRRAHRDRGPGRQRRPTLTVRITAPGCPRVRARRSSSPMSAWPMAATRTATAAGWGWASRAASCASTAAT